MLNTVAFWIVPLIRFARPMSSIFVGVYTVPLPTTKMIRVFRIVSCIKHVWPTLSNFLWWKGLWQILPPQANPWLFWTSMCKYRRSSAEHSQYYHLWWNLQRTISITPDVKRFESLVRVVTSLWHFGHWIILLISRPFTSNGSKGVEVSFSHRICLTAEGVAVTHSSNSDWGSTCIKWIIIGEVIYTTDQWRRYCLTQFLQPYKLESW